MKFSTVANTALLATFAHAGCENVGGNYYCSSTDSVVYSNVGYSGSYQDVTSMDESSCACAQSSVSFEGNMAPLDEELSVHFRGPIKLLQFGVYYPGSSVSLGKRDAVEANDEESASCTTTARKHHEHKREAAVQWVEVTSTVVVGGNGEPISEALTPIAEPTNNYEGTTTLAPQSSAAAASSAASPAESPSSSSSSSSSSAAAASSSSSSGSSSGSSSNSASAWNRVSYFTPGSAQNLTFMNHQGGTKGSGTWSSCFGNSISFCDSDGVTGAASPVALDEVTVPSNKEFMIFSGSKCGDSSSNGDCGYYREGIPAYHGFGGNTKMFVFEFSMPNDNSGDYNVDMPAVWLLNAKIPRTLQYGDSTCSCWKTGCGEFDLFEILSSGSDKLISHIHDGQGNDGTSSGGGGTQDYFQRPTSGTLKAAVIFNGSDKTIHVVEVDDSFDGTISADTVNSWFSKGGSSAPLS